jgi:FPC/CPF motif-containing protein YcgG
MRALSERSTAKLASPSPERNPTEAEVQTALRTFVLDESFPCLAARGVLRRDGCTLRVYGELGDERGGNADLARDLGEFTRAPGAEGDRLISFAAAFPGTPRGDEAEFERRLWLELQKLHDSDDPSVGWDPSVSDAADDPRFAFSFAGRAYFVIGMHPDSSRIARRFPWPMLVFNAHAQFDRLRADGQYERLRDSIRARDIALQGTPNPSLADFGQCSEARQYSGRAPDEEWRCPFHAKR